MPKLILNISSMGGKYGRSFTLPAFYVMISRVRSFEGLRLLKRDLKAMGKLLKLKPNEYLHAYENGHDKDWDGKRAWFALTALRRERLEATVKGAEEKAAEKKAKAQASAALKRERAAAEKSAKAKATKAKKAVAAAAAARERVAEGQPSAKRHGGSSAGQQPSTPSTGAMARVGTVVAGRSRGRT
jgi:hypothetical protein